MMNFRKSRTWVLIMSTLLVFVACKKNEDSKPSPVTDPISIASAKPGDTMVIKGQHFSEVPDENIVQFNGARAKVVKATVTALTVVIPADATSGAVTVTVNGNTVEVGSLVLTPLTLYCIKENEAADAPEQLVAIDPSNGRETLIATLTDIPEYAIPDILYLAATNEVVGCNDSGTALMKINVTTKQASTVRLYGSSPDVTFEHLVADKEGNLYGIKTDKSDDNSSTQSLVKIDPQTGNVASVKIIAQNKSLYWRNLAYLSASNEIAGIANLDHLFKLDLDTKDTGSIQLTNSAAIAYHALVPDGKGSLIACKSTMLSEGGYQLQFVQIDPVTGAQSVLVTYNDYPLVDGTLCFLPGRNEVTGIWDGTGLYKYNVDTKTSSVLPLTDQSNIYYVSMTSN